MTGVRIALLGLGAAARDIHGPACQELAGVEVVAGADPEPEARKRFSSRSVRSRTRISKRFPRLSRLVS